MKKRDAVILIIGLVAFLLTICFRGIALGSAIGTFSKSGDWNDVKQWFKDIGTEFKEYSIVKVDGDKVVIDETGIHIADDDDTIKIDKTGVYVTDNDEKVTVSKDGVFVDTDDAKVSVDRSGVTVETDKDQEG